MISWEPKVTNMATMPPSSSAAPVVAACRVRGAAALVLLFGASLSAMTCGNSGVDVGALCPGSASNPQRALTSAAMTPAEFCDLFLQTCGGANSPRGGYTTTAECVAAYPALMFESTRECRSYHLCNSAAYDKTNPLLHCQHAVGIDLCADTGP